MGTVLRRNKPAVALADSGGLPTDVLFEVLLRFPANVLCRLRLVCRSWRSLTSDPIFARAHASRHPLVTAIHFSVSSQEVRVVDLSGNIVKRMPLAQANYAMTTQLDMVCVTGVFIQNPGSVLDLAAGEAVTALSFRDDVRGTSEVISPFLLGHVPSTGEYKVFYSDARAVTVYGEEGVHAVQVCSVTTLGDSGDGGRWRAKPAPAQIASSTRERVVVVGVAYFLLSIRCTGNNNPANNVEPDAIAVFDLAAEEWRPASLQGPLSSRLAGGNQKLVYEEHRHNIQLAAMDGCLVTVHHNHRQNGSMDLWFLVDKELWNKLYSIRSATHCYALRTSYPLLLLDDGRIVIWDEGVDVLRVYDPRINKWADLATLEKYYVFMNMYQGNLLCPGLPG
ncbi:unnamed protein product [Urochloa decumbens]|uniref:F-box domain-containing protein n=1 Tax=Urochloa decumbens TaxID=240449 RepID=A0ABC9FPY6_9POAL